MQPPVIKQLSLQSTSLCKNMAHASEGGGGRGCANYMHPMSWGTNGKDLPYYVMARALLLGGE